ncbi:zf-HC2 domain-containing protein [Streptomyces sp. NBC_00053]|uniref:zf-HC2 domain-containing protein n=1 Tax=unclassified Streptomyces TaxID=2593676 RepID=UPI000FBBE183|nr:MULTISPECIES: zf-HC2 domain-containing protein [unclassified Streptomyces]WSG53337.1 zf-HC2 domain-containing protein [Streptomyces sp. NBC_01732]WSX03989.1 zf-HC2 domain-containing protein [Streptomyces sp. NBC_00987]MCX5105909.1 zf-HC2 domain-containing protein [Streptomyces sp. NBC_00439]MCX5162951.1 zf-HC2 domain-containing protein [Streptomyces sp. NBC_00305]MCX5221468.1 zf-HC2 domain-containing protein [Streptomyces sp. NBC_00264]
MTTTGGAGMPHWHVSEELAGRYAAGSVPETDAWSVEKHVETCGGCAARLSAAVRVRPETGAVLDGVRAGVLAAVAAEAAPAKKPVRVAARGPVRGPARGLVRLTAPRTAAADGAPAKKPVPVAPFRFAGAATRAGRLLWAAGPALRGSWLVALVLVAVGAVALAYGAGAGEAVRPLLLVVAPVLPLAGVGLSYGRHADPMYEITAATPSGGLRLLLTRTAAVLVLSIPALTLAGAALPASAGRPGAAAWLLPGLAMTLAALALGSYVGCRTGATSIAVAWAAAVVLPVFAASPPAALAAATGAARYFAGPAAQAAWAAGALVCAALLAVRRRSFDHLETL